MGNKVQAAKIIVGSFVVLASSIGIADTIYQSTDKQGHPIFTDQPQPTAKPIELKPINTTPSVTPMPREQTQTPAFAGYSKVAVAVPSSIPNGLAPVAIGIVVQPPLQAGHHWSLLLDGAEQAQGQAESATLEKMERGSHQLQLQIIDQNGSVIGSSTPTDVFVFWPSKNR